MNDEIERLRQLSLCCHKQARFAASEEAAEALASLAAEYEAKALELFKAARAAESA